MPWSPTAKMTVSQTPAHYLGDGRELAFKENHSSRFIIAISVSPIRVAFYTHCV